MANVAVLILTYNETIHIERAIKTVAAFAREIFVIDSFSSDTTVELARRLGANVLQNRFLSHAKQIQWALNNAPITSDWIFRLDADEVVEAGLAAEIEENLPRLPPDIVGINLKGKHIFMDRWIRFGGRYPLMKLRIWRRGNGAPEDRWLDEHIVVWGGRTITFNGGFADHNLNDLAFFTDKHNRYSTRGAIEVLRRRYRLGKKESLSAENSSWQAASKRYIKENVYDHLPLWAGPMLYFIYRYFLLLGFLDGKPGLIYHFLQGFWHQFLIGSKVYELERALSGIRDPAAMKAELTRLTGLEL